MQKKSNLGSSSSSEEIVIKLSDLNSEESIKNWIINELKYKDSNLSNDNIKDALNGILRDGVFIKGPENIKSKFINRINELVKNL
jgi:hypothetical protein